MSEEEEDEQVVGAMAWCESCSAKTVHVDGKCREHKVIRRKKPRPTKPPEVPRRRGSLFPVLVAVVLIGGYFFATRVLGYGRAKDADPAQATACAAQEDEIVRLKREVALLQSELSDLEDKLRHR